jgi:hypothetical protein
MHDIMTSLVLNSPMFLNNPLDNVMNKKYHHTGIWTCPHSLFGSMTVVAYADNFSLSVVGLLKAAQISDGKTIPTELVDQTLTEEQLPELEGMDEENS